LGVNFEKTMLVLKFHIDYRQFSKRDNSSTISSAYQKWQNEKSPLFFQTVYMIYGWKTNKEVDFDALDKSITQTLKRFGYEVL